MESKILQSLAECQNMQSLMQLYHQNNLNQTEMFSKYFKGKLHSLFIEQNNNTTITNNTNNSNHIKQNLYPAKLRNEAMDLNNILFVQKDNTDRYIRIVKKYSKIFETKINFLHKLLTLANNSSNLKDMEVESQYSYLLQNDEYDDYEGQEIQEELSLQEQLQSFQFDKANEFEKYCLNNTQNSLNPSLSLLIPIQHNESSFFNSWESKFKYIFPDNIPDNSKLNESFMMISSNEDKIPKLLPEQGFLYELFSQLEDEKRNKNKTVPTKLARKQSIINSSSKQTVNSLKYPNKAKKDDPRYSSPNIWDKNLSRIELLQNEMMNEAICISNSSLSFQETPFKKQQKCLNEVMIINSDSSLSQISGSFQHNILTNNLINSQSNSIPNILDQMNPSKTLKKIIRKEYDSAESEGSQSKNKNNILGKRIQPNNTNDKLKQQSGQSQFENNFKDIKTLNFDDIPIIQKKSKNTSMEIEFTQNIPQNQLQLISQKQEGKSLNPQLNIDSQYLKMKQTVVNQQKILQQNIKTNQSIIVIDNNIILDKSLQQANKNGAGINLSQQIEKRQIGNSIDSQDSLNSSCYIVIDKKCNKKITKSKILQIVKKGQLSSPQSSQKQNKFKRIIKN